MMSQRLLESPYGYIPTRWICDMFVVLFGVTTSVHVVEAFYFKPRLFWILPTIVICGVGEIVGWSARLWSSDNPDNNTPFMTQLITTIIAPTFLTAALYTILGPIVLQLGSQYSRLGPKAYIIIFVSADVLALVIQSVGGAIAAGAITQARANLGAHIMVGGICFQLASITVYALLAAELLLRFYFQKPVSVAASSRVPRNNGDNEKPLTPRGSGALQERGIVPPRVGLMVIGLVLATLLVYIRSIYRTIELLGGWHGRVITTELYFNVLDGSPIVLAMFVINVLHPGFLLQVPDTSRVTVGLASL